MDFEMVMESSKHTGKKKAFSGWIYFNNYNVLKNFQIRSKGFLYPYAERAKRKSK